MKYSYALAGLAALAAASDVEDLTKDTFDAFVKSNDLVLAEFFAPWCGHCKALAPEYEDAATQLKDKEIKLAKVDCTEQQDLCQQYGVEGYPTLKIFRGADNITPYGGPRKADAIVSYMTKQSLPPVSLLQSKQALEDFKGADKVVVVAYFAADDKTSNTTFSEVAESLRNDFPFAASSDAELAKEEGVKQPAVVLYKTFDEGKTFYTDKFDKAKIEEFTKVASLPLVGEVGPETYAGYMAAGIPLAYIFAESAEEREQLAKDLKSIAEENKGKLNFATIDAGAFGQHASNLNLEVGKWPAFAIQDTAKSQKFPYEKAGNIKDLTAKNIGKYVKDYLAGKIEPSIKSEPIPEKQEGPVTVVVAKNYQDVVINNEKDVLVEFYAPWCGHCKALSPKYDELAELYKPYSDKVIIAKVDATANDVPEEIQGFPTIKLFKSGSKAEPVDYTGSRSVEDLAKFVFENGSHKVEAKAVEKETEQIETSDLPHQAAAATESASSASDKATDKVKSVVSGAAEAVKSAVADDEGVADAHDEL